jgi:hypothetical protein
MTSAAKIIIGVNSKTYPQFLYKYRADNSNTKKIITDNELYFSNPREFNDPYDCNIPISVKSSINEIKKWLKSVGIAEKDIDKYAEQLNKNPNCMKDAIEKSLNQIGICCFSTMDDSILQWSHYSHYHQGICLKFDITEDPEFFLFLVTISYRKVMQHYNHFTQSDKIVKYLIQPKFSEWSYESEIRIVKPDHLMKLNNGNRLFKYKNIALKEVIFGAETPDSTKDKYQQLCANSNKGHVQFYQMQHDSGVHYKLNKIKL